MPEHKYVIIIASSMIERQIPQTNDKVFELMTGLRSVLYRLNDDHQTGYETFKNWKGDFSPLMLPRAWLCCQGV